MAEIIRRLRRHHEPQEAAIFHEIVKMMPDAPSMIELGSFWAYYSLWLLQARPAASVIGVEPDRSHIEIGRPYAALNGRTTTFIEASVGAQALEPRPFETESSGVTSIPQVIVPQLMADAGLDRLGLLHCDTQGAETEILTSCRPLLERGAIRFCIVSTHHHLISGDALTHERCLHLMKAAGGLILAEHSVAESFSGNSLIAAFFGTDPIYLPEFHLSYNRTFTSLFRDPLFDLADAWGNVDRQPWSSLRALCQAGVTPPSQITVMDLGRPNAVRWRRPTGNRCDTDRVAGRTGLLRRRAPGRAEGNLRGQTTLFYRIRRGDPE
ncbi:hypothetical protein [Methylobacterium sp. UNC378MF]|uniref:hypothetical protein n=1 Tax=Methylobacterium sp. UNC378MF TaxID=1502748 RepID=UPI0011139B48|nr:hypothetical protein [Methylobacterium sp. UNC378MF]